MSSWTANGTKTTYAQYCYDMIKGLTTIHIGASEGAGHTNATYTSVKVVYSPLEGDVKYITCLLTGYTAFDVPKYVKPGSSLSKTISRNPGYVMISQEVMFPDGTTSAYEGDTLALSDIQTDISVRCIGQQL